MHAYGDDFHLRSPVGSLPRYTLVYLAPAKTHYCTGAAISGAKHIYGYAPKLLTRLVILSSSPGPRSRLQTANSSPTQPASCLLCPSIAANGTKRIEGILWVVFALDLI